MNGENQILEEKIKKLIGDFAWGMLDQYRVDMAIKEKYGREYLQALKALGLKAEQVIEEMGEMCNYKEMQDYIREEMK